MAVAPSTTTRRRTNTSPLRRPTRPVYRLDAYLILWLRPYTPDHAHRLGEWFEAELICFHGGNFLRWQPRIFRAANNPRGWWAIDGIDRFTKRDYAVLRDAIFSEVENLSISSKETAR